MARRFSVKKLTISNFDLRLKFEAEQLEEGGTVLSTELFDEVVKSLNEVAPTLKDQNSDSVAAAIFTSAECVLHSDPTNVYENMMGDKQQQTKMVSVELVDTEGNSVIYGE